MLKNLYNLEEIQTDNYRRLNYKRVKELAESIKMIGLQEPIQLFQVNETRQLFVVSGHHRLEAIKQIRKLPGFSDKVYQAEVVRGSLEEYLSQNTAIKSVIANSLRQEMGIVDKSLAYQKLVKTGLTPKMIGTMLHRTEKSITRTLRVAALPPEVQEFLYLNPTIAEETILRAAHSFEKNNSYQILRTLKKKQEVHPRSRQVGASKSLNTQEFRKKLLNKGFNRAQIKEIIRCTELKD